MTIVVDTPFGLKSEKKNCHWNPPTRRKSNITGAIRMRKNCPDCRAEEELVKKGKRLMKIGIICWDKPWHLPNRRVLTGVYILEWRINGYLSSRTGTPSYTYYLLRRSWNTEEPSIRTEIQFSTDMVFS